MQSGQIGRPQREQRVYARTPNFGLLFAFSTIIDLIVVHSISLPPGQYGLMTYLHQGKQYVVVPRNGGYTTLALP